MEILQKIVAFPEYMNFNREPSLIMFAQEQPAERDLKCEHSMLRQDATPQKRWLGFDFKFKKFSIKQAFFINEIFSSRVKESKQKKLKFFFAVF